MINQTAIDRLEEEICESPKAIWEALIKVPGFLRAKVEPTDVGLELIDALITALPVIREQVRAMDLSSLEAIDDLFYTFDALAKAKATIDAEEAENCEREEACEDAESRELRRRLHEEGL